jgi:hypothetical protein
MLFGRLDPFWLLQEKNTLGLIVGFPLKETPPVRTSPALTSAGSIQTRAEAFTPVAPVGATADVPLADKFTLLMVSTAHDAPRVVDSVTGVLLTVTRTLTVQLPVGNGATLFPERFMILM